MGYGIIHNLNPEQKEAAQGMYGTHVVVAGAGTGKTQILAARIANMLTSEVMISPSMILALTFTDAGVVAMRKRLVSVIGVEAYKIAIHTFHSFCNEIIQVNPAYFMIKDFEPISQLEQLEIVYKIIDQLPFNNPLKRLSGNPYYEAPRMLRFFQTFKDENYTVEGVKDAAQRYLDSLPEREEYIYKRANKKKGISVGDVKKDLINKEAERIALVIAASELVQKYNDLMAEKKRYDFSDMIFWVLKAFQKDEYFLLNYQEHYQYLLVDEFQDTNNSQLALINTLMNFWDNPNIFVVGDDDQSVYEFNGARIKNIIDFIQQYQPAITVLKSNYRSTQPILDAADSVISNNEQRLINELPGLSKELVSAKYGNRKTLQPHVFEFGNTALESAWAAEYIEHLISENELPSEIAVLYRKHRQSEDLLQQLKVKRIPYNIRKRLNVLDTVIVKQILEIIEYIVSYQEVQQQAIENKLFNILHFRFWDNDISKIHKYYISRLDKDSRSRKPVDIVKVETILDNLINDYNNSTFIQHLHRLLKDTGLIDYVLALDDSVEVLNYVSTFFNWVKAEVYKDSSINGRKLLEMISKMRDNSLTLSVENLHGSDEGVNLMTIHGSKGLEFKHVIMLGCNRHEWEKSRSGALSYTLPDTLTFSGGEDKLESNRRLFYVGMTRAKEDLTITYAGQSVSGKDLEATQFIAESGLEISPAPEVKNITGFVKNSLTLPTFDMRAVNKEIIANRLANLKLSISAVSKYLKCQVAYYYENVLRVPFVAHPALIFGNATHASLRSLYEASKINEPLSWSAFYSVFEEYMDRNLVQMNSEEYLRRIELGRTILRAFYAHEFPKSNHVTLNEFHIPRLVLPNGVPFTGDIDKMEFNGNMVDVVDYKTGNPKNAAKKAAPPSEKDLLGGDYWRQGVAYKIMLDNLPGRNWRFNTGRLDILTPKSVNKIEIPVTPEYERIVLNQIKQAYDGILAQEFSHGCEDENCVWCNFEKQLNK